MFDHDKGETLIRVLVGSAPAAGDSHYLVHHANQSMTESNTFVYYDDRVPTLSISPSASPSSGGSVVFMTLSNFDVNGDLTADEVIVMFGEVTIALAEVLEVEISTPTKQSFASYTILSFAAGRLAVQVQVSS